MMALSVLLAFLVLVLPMVTAQPGSINGRCDAEICVCILPAIVSCPTWFGRISDGGVYKQTISKTCGRDNICGGWMYDTLTPFTVTDSSCSGDTVETSKFDYWALLDGNLTSATLLMNYTEQDPPPACSLDIPFTFTPSMQPTTSPAPTAEPTMSGSRSAGQGLGRTTLVASVGLAGIVVATMLVI